jgi:site-specific DNA recombinase
MNELQVAFYARISSEQQVISSTIQSQLSALHARIKQDGGTIRVDCQFVDEGYSGSTLIRPALERLRDLVASGCVDRLYVHSPDRLARKYAYQVVLVDEFKRSGVEIIFLNHALGKSPEDDLLLQVQGMIAEYERAKIMERSRRGKRHKAKLGSVNVLSGAPYGYRYVTILEGDGQARYDILPEEAQVVRQVFEWVGLERLSINEASRRLTKMDVNTRTGKNVWDRATIWDMLKNPAYQGKAAFGKTRVGPMLPRLRAQRGQSLQPRRAQSTYAVPDNEWLTIPVPEIISESLFSVVQDQLQENQRRARIGQRGARYLLQGLLVCAGCGYAYYGKPVSLKSSKGRLRTYAYYRCIGSDAYRFGGQRICSNTQVRTDRLEDAVWQEVRGLLENPERLALEYKRRLQEAQQNVENPDATAIKKQTAKLRQGISRLIDSYAEGLIDKNEFEPRIGRLKKRVQVLNEQTNKIVSASQLQNELQLVIGHLDEFRTKVASNLEQLDWLECREIIRTLVKQVEIDQNNVKVIFRVDSGPFVGSSGILKSGQSNFLQHCRRGDIAFIIQYFIG